MKSPSCILRQMLLRLCRTLEEKVQFDTFVVNAPGNAVQYLRQSAIAQVSNIMIIYDTVRYAVRTANVLVFNISRAGRIQVSLMFRRSLVIRRIAKDTKRFITIVPSVRSACNPSSFSNIGSFGCFYNFVTRIRQVTTDPIRPIGRLSGTDKDLVAKISSRRSLNTVKSISSWLFNNLVSKPKSIFVEVSHVTLSLELAPGVNPVCKALPKALAFGIRLYRL